MAPFNARGASTFSANRLYRVYIVGSEVFFIQIAGQDVSRALAMHFGLIGVLINAALKKSRIAKLEAKVSQIDLMHPSTQLGENKHNFRVFSTEFETSSLQAASFLQSYGRHFGRWVFKRRDQKEMTVQLETLEDMRAAFEQLPKALSQHVNMVVWDAEKNKFVKAE